MIDIMPQDLIGPLYVGAVGDSVPSFLQYSFDGRKPPRRRPASEVMLTASFTRAYEAAPYEEDGCVLEVWLRSGCRWTYRPSTAEEGAAPPQDLVTAERKRFDAARYGDGGEWLVWNEAVVSVVRRLDQRQAIPLLCAAFDLAGPSEVYNVGIVADYADIWWRRAAQNARLAEARSYRQNLERVLRRSLMGRKHSQLVSRASCCTSGLAE